MKIKLSRSQWENMGKKAGWMENTIPIKVIKERDNYIFYDTKHINDQQALTIRVENSLQDAFEMANHIRDHKGLDVVWSNPQDAAEYEKWDNESSVSTNMGN